MARFMSLVFVFLGMFPVLSLADARSSTQNCSCGFFDRQTDEFFTDSIIIYFNETTTIPNDFIIEDYEKKYEKDWNAMYRQGAIPSNVQLNESDSLQLLVSPSTKLHLVNGGEIQTTRRDIQYGSFRTFIKSPGSNNHGSAMSMMWQYNDTETTELSVMNTDVPSNAWVGTFIGGEFTTRDLGVNFSTLQDNPAPTRNYTPLDGVLDNGTVNPWEYVEYRIDWTKDYISFYIGGNLTRSVLHESNRGLPSVPSPFIFKHWSTGNRFSMEGPPKQASIASIGWMRLFFNSSTMTDQQHGGFADRCRLIQACLIDDPSLRGSTRYGETSSVAWKQRTNESIKRMPALWISVISIGLSTLLLIHAFIRRAPWRKQPKSSSHQCAPNPPDSTTEPSFLSQSEYVSSSRSMNQFVTTDSGTYCASSYKPSASVKTHPSSSKGSKDLYESKDDLVIERMELGLDTLSYCDSTLGGPSCDPSRPASLRFDSHGTTPHVLSPQVSQYDMTREDVHPALRSRVALDVIGTVTSRNYSESTIVGPQVGAQEDKIPMETVTESALPAPRMRPQPPLPRERVDYLAGMVALCAILVTVMHFGLTFVPAMVVPGAPQHNESEYWAQQIVAPFILNQMWLGVFFTTSVRFLVASYLKKGNMQDIAKAAVRRTPRLMIPVASIALLEYFLIDVGATNYLRYIPSLTWSTWPYVTRYPTFGHYISEVLELVYLVPNAVPQITYNYCTGVLWTIAVQIQGTWLVLCGVLVIYEIKTPWKRMCYYGFCLISHWYAESWGSYLWLGLLLTDLDITYNYKTWLHSRPGVYYPLITCCWLCVAAGFAANIIPNWTDFNFATYEHNVHPDPETGEPIWNTKDAGYPPYYVPRLNGLLFAGGMQAIVEISPIVQWVLSLPFLLVLFPHIFTIYLMHGMVFWSWGSWLMILIAERDISYSVNVTIVGVTSYVVLFASLPVITPIIEALGKDITALVWMSAIEKPAPRRKTLFPFPDDLFSRREKHDIEAATGGVIGGSGHTLSNDKV